MGRCSKNIVEILVLLSVFSNRVDAEGPRKALKTEFRWAASVQKEEMIHFCGGSVVSQTSVLTACGPLFGYESTVYVMAGSNLLMPIDKETWTGQRRNSSEVILHEDCVEVKRRAVNMDYFGWGSNYAIIKLEEPFTLNENLITMVPPHNLLLPDFDRTREMVGQTCTIVSWGYFPRTFKENITPHNDLMAQDVRIMTMFDCEREVCAFFEEGWNTALLCESVTHDPQKRKELCALHPVDEKTKGLLGDVGGSLTCGGEVHAITSWRPLRLKYFDVQEVPAGPKVPTLFASVAAHWVWISNKVPDLPPFKPPSKKTTISFTTLVPDPTTAGTLSRTIRLYIQSTVLCLIVTLVT